MPTRLVDHILDFKWNKDRKIEPIQFLSKKAKMRIFLARGDGKSSQTFAKILECFNEKEK